MIWPYRIPCLVHCYPKLIDIDSHIVTLFRSTSWINPGFLEGSTNRRRPANYLENKLLLMFINFTEDFTSKHSHSCLRKMVHYCWWKDSCTSWYGKYPIIYRVLCIPGGAGFLPSTVCFQVPRFPILYVNVRPFTNDTLPPRSLISGCGKEWRRISAVSVETMST